jgi:Bacteriodetes cell division protein (FtsL-like)
MATTTRTNTPKDYTKANQGNMARPGLFRLLENALRLDVMFDRGLPVEHLPRVLFVAGLIIVYIANTHLANKMVFKLNKVKAEVEDLRVDYTTSKAEYMYASKQSEVARNVKAQGLQESEAPPRKLVLNP